MPSKFSVRQLRETGQSFENFLLVQGLDMETNREQLRIIYNQNFKTSIFGKSVPGFSSMLYGMKTANLAYVTKTRVRFFKLDRWADVSDLNTDHKSLLAKIFHDRAEYLHGKHGVDVEVQGPHEDRDGQLLIHLDLDRKEVLTLRLRNGGTQSVTLTHVFPLFRSPQFTFVYGNQELPCSLGPGQCYELRVHCQTSFVGYFPATVLWELLGPEEPRSKKAGTFYIARFLAAVAHSPLAAQLKPTTPYRQPRVTGNPVTTTRVEEGQRPDRTRGYDLELTLPLGKYNPPPQLRQLLPQIQGTNIFTAPKKIAEIKAQLETALKYTNYETKFRLLLHLEELQMEYDIRHYDLESVPMTLDLITQSPKLLTLEVPGVAESRPSVLRGDHLFALLSSEAHQNNSVTYKGFVHRVELDRVKLSFSTSLLNRFVDGLTFKVKFTFNRQPLQVQHRALELTRRHQLWPTLFPKASHGVPLLSSEVKLKLYDRNLESNPEQLQAVKSIVMGTSRPAPYIIFGPPGTGKTVTVVEAIKQVVKHLPKAHILACAPSNSGADLLCQRLRPHLSGSIYRLLAPSRDIRMVPEDIKPCCNWDAGKGEYVFPSKKKLQEYRVIITTLITASRLVSAQFPISHFTHIFIDEAGQCMEPESLVAIAGLVEVKESSDDPGGQLVLAGDPRQLGPVLRSPLAQKHGLRHSLLERLLTHNPLYKKGARGYNPQFITKLLCNYRSHPTILDVPNRLYYEGELLARANVMDRERFCHWEGLPQPGFPIIFHGVMGKDEREGNSPSFFNPEEAAKVTDYLKQLLTSSSKKGKGHLSPRHVGVISPYRKQVEKIRECITRLDKKLRGLDDIKDLKVGSVEEFQGQERNVIIISTVRSSQSFVQLDLDFSLGFLKNPKRFNVAVTRAKALLIVVGNPLLLGHDPDWKAFLDFCKEKGGYTGCPFPATLEMEQGQNLLKDLSKLSSSTSGPRSHNYLSQDLEGEGDLPLQVEPEWRNEL